jgi:hypothetical protein
MVMYGKMLEQLQHIICISQDYKLDTGCENLRGQNQNKLLEKQYILSFVTF